MKHIAASALASAEVVGKVTQLYQKRTQTALERFSEHITKSAAAVPSSVATQSPSAFAGWQEYATDLAQRSILFWDTLRQRGNQYLEHERAGSPPVLAFDYETVLDGRSLARPVNYTLVRIVPPKGVTVDPKRRPYMIIDPRAGHGPGVGGMKDDSQVGVALRGGHPVYFVIFSPQPVPGQTILDVSEAEREFLCTVRKLHPESAKPVVIGNCQGGWAAMMLAAANPDEIGPIVINGAPMSYWGGAFSEGPGDNPMRYAGGALGGTWLSSLTADMGDGVFDGAHLVQNFENLNPANTHWNKYYKLFSKVDTEAPRFLEFERWWGAYYLMNAEEIEWITQNLFVGNKLWKGGVKSSSGDVFDLRKLRSPIILFASLGDNITPPQQAFNWVADVYGSTEEIKAHGQVIVGLLHQDAGHLGIFVSGQVAKKEYTQIVSVLKSIELLPPGLYGMKIVETRARGGEVEHQVEFEERRLEEVAARLNRVERRDEKPFEAAAALSEFNQHAYETFAQPLVRAMATPATAQLGRQFHKLRVERWALSDLNPFLWWTGPAAEAIRPARVAVEAEHPLRQVENSGSEFISASWDLFRDLRDAQAEAAFFLQYGNLEHLARGDGPPPEPAPSLDARELKLVKQALAGIAKGGYAEAVARCDYLLKPKNSVLPLEQLHLKAELIADYADLLPPITPDAMRRIHGEQQIIVDLEPERAIETLPELLAAKGDRERLLRLIDRLFADQRIQGLGQTPEQVAMLERIRQVLAAPAALSTPTRAARAAKAGQPARTKR